MDPDARHLRALLAELARLEDRVWARNPEEAGAPARRGDMLAYLMTDDEWRQWRALGAIVLQMRKRI